MRYPYPPKDFVCSYQHNCPYLDFLSTKWVLGEYRHADIIYHEHLLIIDRFSADLKASEDKVKALERENAELKAKLMTLHRRQFKANKKQEEDKENDEAGTAGGESSKGKNKKRGAPVGHPAWARPRPERIDQTIHVNAPEICPYCKSFNITLTKGINEHIQEDIVIQPRTIITRYLHEEALCHGCGQTVIQAGPNEIIGSYIGPVAKSAAIYLRYRIGAISYRKVSTIFRDLFSLSFVPASAFGFDRKAVKKGKPLYDDLLEKIRSSDMLHADETSWRNNGIGHFVWFLGNKNLAYFHIDRHRSSEVAKYLLTNFEGVLVRDRYAAYNNIGTDWQSCLAHISTTAKETAKEHALLPPAHRDIKVEIFCKKVRFFCKIACMIWRKLESGIIPREKAAYIENKFIEKINKFCKVLLNFKPAENLREYLAGPEQKSLLTFLRVPGVPPTNNHAEQSQRYLVIFRKICFGTRSDTGLITHSILPTLVQTARRQNIHPRDFLQILFTADTKTAQAALYKNSS